jgi:hypothetical protein
MITIINAPEKAPRPFAEIERQVLQIPAGEWEVAFDNSPNRREMLYAVAAKVNSDAGRFAFTPRLDMFSGKHRSADLECWGSGNDPIIYRGPEVLSLFEKVRAAILDHEDQTAAQFSPALREGPESLMKEVESSGEGAASGRRSRLQRYYDYMNGRADPESAARIEEELRDPNNEYARLLQGLCRSRPEDPA